MPPLRIHHLAATHHHDGVGFIHTRGPVLGAIQQPTIAMAFCGGGDLVGVGTRIGLGDGKRHAFFARGQTRQPFVLQSLAAMGLNNGGAYRPNHQRQHGAALCSCFFHNDVVVSQTAATATIFLGNMDAQEACLAHGVPQLDRLGFAFDNILKVAAAKTAHQFPHTVSQHRMVVCGINQGRTKNI